MVATFGEYIKQRRTELGFPMRKVASRLDIDTSTYGKIEREERTLSTELIPNLAEILEIEYKELLNHYYSTKLIQELKYYPNYKRMNQNDQSSFDISMINTTVRKESQVKQPLELSFDLEKSK